MGKRTWTDEELREAVAISRSWRSTLRELGLKSSSSIHVAKRHAERLGLDTSHFTGPRRWTDDELIAAIDESDDWEQVATRLKLATTRRTALRLKGQALRLGVDSSHLEVQPDNSVEVWIDPTVRDAQLPALRLAAPSLAASWFALRRFSVAFPAEHESFDLLAIEGSMAHRVQVKTTTYKAPNGSWQVGIGHRPYSLDNSASKQPYDPDDIDYFFIVNGDGEIYLIPIAVVAGLTNIYLDTYPQYRVGDASSLLS